MTLTKALFSLDAFNGVPLATPLVGWHEVGNDWNGWALPVFQKAQANTIVYLYNSVSDQQRAWHAASNDTFYFFSDGGALEAYQGTETEIDGEMVTVYGIGSSVWTWNLEPTPPQNTYDVTFSLGITVTVHASSEKEAKRIADPTCTAAIERCKDLGLFFNDVWVVEHE